MTTKRIADIAARVKLCTLETGAWRATRLNKDESQKVNRAHALVDTAKVHVRLTNSPTLHAINKLHAAAYDAHQTLTLPCIQKGLRLLPAGKEFAHAAKMKEFAAEHARLKASFLVEYDDEKRTAPVRLNGLYDASQWPSVGTIAGRFTFITRYLECPHSGAWGDWLTESARAAEDELRERLTECLHHLATTCKGDGKLYQSVFTNLREICELVPDLNFTDVPEFAAVAAAAQALGRLDADVLREDKAARRTASEKAASILTLFGTNQ